MRMLPFLGALPVFCLPAALAAILAGFLSASSRDEWKVAAWVPVIPLALWGPYIAFDVTRDPTSHNLWPFELVVWGLLTVVLFVVFLLGRSILSRPPADWRVRRKHDDA